MNGIAEALKLIQDTAQDARVATMHKLPGGGRRVLMQISGGLVEYNTQPEDRRHTVHTLDDLIAYTIRASEANTGPVVWHGVHGVTLIIRDEDRADMVKFPLSFSERYRCLQRMAKEKPGLRQDQFVKLLRIELGIDPLVISKFRKLDWETGDKGTSETRHGDNRLAKSVIAKVQGLEELPEELMVPAPVYQQQGERQEYSIRCAVEIDAVNRLFQLVPMPDELEYALDLAQASIEERLAADISEIPIYYGEP